jgi:predicted permease
LFVDLPLDWRVLGFAIALVGVTAVAFGLTPALRATSMPVQQMMKTGGRVVSGDRRRHGLQATLVVVQVSLSMVMVTSAVFFALSLRNLSTFDTGHRMDGVLAADLSIARQGLPDDRLPALHRALVDRLRATSGIESVARTAIVPMSGSAMRDMVRVDRGGASAELETAFHHVGPRYFRTVGQPLVSGRDFDDRDRVGSRRVAVVNRTFALRLLSTTAPAGRVFYIQATPGTWVPYDIVGMAEDAVYSDVREPVPPVAYLAIEQDPDPDREPVFLIHSRLPPAVLRSSVARAIADIGPGISIEFSALSKIVRNATQRERLLAGLSAGLGVLALALSAVGIYGVLSYLVVRRRQEIGVRLALGATRSDVVRMVAGQSLGWVGAGLGAGGLLAVLTATAARSMLFGLTPTDPLALVAAAVTLATTGAAATIIPALHAGRLQPTSALRED